MSEQDVSLRLATLVAQGTKLGDEALIKIGRAAVAFVAKYDASVKYQDEATERMEQ